MLFLSENLASVAKFPLVLVICFTMLFYYLGWSFMSGIAVFVIAFLINVTLGKINAQL